jgi:hypothetical protein
MEICGFVAKLCRSVAWSSQDVGLALYISRCPKPFFSFMERPAALTFWKKVITLM